MEKGKTSSICKYLYFVDYVDLTLVTWWHLRFTKRKDVMYRRLTTNTKSHSFLLLVWTQELAPPPFPLTLTLNLALPSLILFLNLALLLSQLTLPSDLAPILSLLTPHSNLTLPQLLNLFLGQTLFPNLPYDCLTLSLVCMEFRFLSLPQSLNGPVDSGQSLLLSKRMAWMSLEQMKCMFVTSLCFHRPSQEVPILTSWTFLHINNHSILLLIFASHFHLVAQSLSIISRTTVLLSSVRKVSFILSVYS